MSPAEKLAGLSNFEQIYGSLVSYLDSYFHDTSYYLKAAADAKFFGSGNDGSGSGSDADLIYKSTGNLHAAAFAGLGIPAGLIIWWRRPLDTIPEGWHICNGEAGTRDLRDRFLVCAGTDSGYSVGDTGGAATFTATGTITVNTHALTIAEMAPHSHPYTDRTPLFSAAETGSGNQINAGSATTSGTTASAGSGSGHGHNAGEGTAMTGDAVASLPFCYALYCIQKL